MSQAEESCSIFEKYKLHKNYFLLFVVFCVFALLKYLSRYESLSNFVMGAIAVSPFILTTAFLTWVYLKDRKNHVLYKLMMKQDVFLKLAFKLTLSVLVILVVLFPGDWKPLLNFFDVVRRSFSLEMYFLIASYLAAFILAGELISFFVRLYQISVGTYHHKIYHVFKKTLYSTFFVFFLLLLFSVLTYPQAFYPITDAVSDVMFTVSQGTVALSKLSGGELQSNTSLLNLAKNAFSKTSSNLVRKMDTTQSDLAKSVALSRDALVQSVADTSKNLTESTNGKVSSDGGKISGAVVLSGKGSDLTVEGTTITKDILPDASLSYNLGSAGKTWNTVYAHRLIGASPVFIGTGSSAQGLTNDGDLVVSSDLEVRGKIYATQIIGPVSNTNKFEGGIITSSIVPDGSNINLGSASNHFSTVYANSLVGVPLNFLPLIGGTLSGNLNLGNHSFTTFNSVLVDNLNADLLDGSQASAFAMLNGRSGGQTITGDTAAGGNLTLSSTNNAAKGKIVFGNSAYDEKSNRLGIGTNTPGALLHLNNATAGQKSLIIQGAQNQSANLVEIYGYDSGGIPNGQTFDNAPVFDDAHTFDNAPSLINLTFDNNPSSLSAIANYNSSSAYSAYNNSHSLKIYAYKIINGIKIFNPTPIVTALNDDNSGRTYTISWSWSPATDADGYRIFKSISDGSANFDKFTDVVGTSFYDTGATDFSQDGTFDGRTSLAYAVNYNTGSSYAANGSQHQLVVYAYELHNGVKIFNNAPLHIIPQIDSSGRNFSLDYSWTAASGADGYRVFDYDSSAGIYVSRYADITTTNFHDAGQNDFTSSGTFNGSTSYTDGHVVNYGSGSSYVANGQEHGVRVYAYKEYAGTKIFNPDYAQAQFTDNNSGQHYTIDWSWTAAAGATGYRVFDFDSGNSINFDKYSDVTNSNFQDASPGSFTHTGTFDGMTEYTGSMMASISKDGIIDAAGFSINGVALSVSGWGNIGGNLADQTDLVSALGAKLSLTGGTMSGILNLPSNGLIVGTTQIVALNGAVGIGTATPSASYQLTVNGDVNVTNGLLRFSGTQIGLNNLKNVAVGSPAVNQVLAFNGTNWVNTTLSSVSAGNVVSFYLQTQAGDISPFKQLQATPGAGSEVDVHATVSNNLSSPTLLEEYISSAAGLGGNQIDGGEWEFDTFGFVSDASGDSEIQIDVFTRATNGTETYLFTANTGSITGTTADAQAMAVNSTQSAFSIAPSDRLVVKYSAKTDLLSGTTIHLLHNGQDHYSHFHTPMLTRHNDMAGLQGGTNQQYYHLTSSEYTGTGTGTFVRQSSPAFTGTTTGITATMVGLGNVPNLAFSGSNTGDNAVNSLYSGLITNATHTGDATGASALTVVGINGTQLSALATGILKNTTTTGVPSIAVAGDFPTLNQNTSGTAAGLSAILVSTSGGSGINNSGTLTWGTGGTLGTNAFTSTAYAPLASPTFTGDINFPGSGVWNSSGNVGIGTISPNALLDINHIGAIAIPGFNIAATDANNAYQLKILGHTGGVSHTQIVTDNSNSRLTVMAGAQNDFAPRMFFIGAQDATTSLRGWGTFDYGSNLYDLDTAEFQVRQVSTGGFTTMFRSVGKAGSLFPSGTVGIGSSVISVAKFSVENTGTTDSFLVNDEASDTTPFVINTDGNVGIGRTSPGYKLDISTPGNSDAQLHINSSNPYSDTGGYISSGAAANLGLAGGTALSGGAWKVKTTTGASLINLGSGAMTFYTNDTSAATPGDILSLSARMKITNTGNVGIGATSPLYKFDVSNDGVAKSLLHFSQSGTDVGGWLTSVGDGNFYMSSGMEYDAGAGGWIQKSSNGVGNIIGGDSPGLSFYTTSGTAVGSVATLAVRMRIDTSGNVGIGTTAPSTNFEVYSPTVTNGIVIPLRVNGRIGNTSGQDGVGMDFNGIWDSSGSAFTLGRIVGREYGGYKGGLSFLVNNNGATAPNSAVMSEAMRMDNVGNVGIGTSSPVARLDVSPTVITTTDLKGMNSGLVYNGGSTMTNYYGHYIATPSGTGIITNKYALVTEAGAGNVGIGTTSPTNILSLGNGAAQKFWIENSVSGTVGRALTVAAGGTVAGGTDIAGGNLILQSGLGTGTGASAISFQTGTTLTTGTTLQTMSTKMTILGNGNVGIGTTSPATLAHVNLSSAAVGTALYSSNSALTLSNQDNSVSADYVVADGTATPGYRGVIRGIRARGTLASPTVPVLNDIVFSVLGGIYDGASVLNTAAVDLKVDGTVSSGVAPQRISFSTKTGGSGGFVERLTIKNDGLIGIGTTSPASSLNIASSLVSTANYGTLSVGSSPWDGSTSGKFVGGSSGTLIAVNAPNVAGLGLIDLQSFGVSRFRVDSTSGVTIGNASAGAQNGTHISDLMIYPTSAINLTAEGSPNLIMNANSFTITGGYATQRFNLFNQSTITAVSALNISTEADTLNIAGAPISAGSATIAKSIGLRISAGTSVAAGVTNAYGLYVDAPTGASNNYAAVFNTGNVGIGTTSPGYKLSVATPGVTASQMQINSANPADDTGMYLTSAASGNGFVSAGAAYNGSAWVAKSATAWSFGGGASGISWSYDTGLTAGNTFTQSTRLKIGTTGLISIGTGNLLAGLDVQNSITATSAVAYGTRLQQTLTAAANNDALDAVYINPTFTDGANTGVTHNGLIVVSGNVGIGTTTPAYTLDVKAAGTGVIARFNNNNSTGCTVADGGTITCTSDVRLKKNINDLNYGLNEIMSLRPVDYNWRYQNDNGQKYLGFIAQEVEQLLPQLIMTDANGYKELNTIGLIPILTKSVQEQQTEIGVQTQSIASLQIKTDSNITTLTDLQKSVDTQLNVVGKSLNVINTQISAQAQSIASLQGKLDDQETRLKDQEALSITLQAQIAKLQELVNPDALALLSSKLDAISEFITISDGKFDLLQGTLKASGVETGKLVISVSAGSENNTIGEAVICPAGKKIDSTILAGGTDYNKCILDDASSDGKSVKVKASAVTKDSKVFVTAKTVSDKPLAVSVIEDGKGFTVETKTVVSEDLKFDWWIVGAK